MPVARLLPLCLRARAGGLDVESGIATRASCRVLLSSLAATATVSDRLSGWQPERLPPHRRRRRTIPRRARESLTYLYDAPYYTSQSRYCEVMAVVDHGRV